MNAATARHSRAATDRMLHEQELRELAQRGQPGSLTIYLPTHRRGPDVREDPIRFGNLLKEANRRLQDAGLDARAAARTLAPLEALLADPDHWQHQQQGLVLFARDGELRTVQLPQQVEPLVFVGTRHCVRPLLRFVDRGQRFCVLALSQHQVRLFECTRESCRELAPLDLPTSLPEALGYDWEQKSLQFHTGVRRRGGRDDSIFHGQGRGSDEAKPELTRFLRAVDHGIAGVIRDGDVPLVLASVGYVASIYRQVSEHRAIVETVVEGNPDTADAAELHARALAAVRPQLLDPREAELARFRDLQHTPLGTGDLSTILTAGRDGRSEVLFVATDAAVWGSFDPEHGALRLHAERQPDDDDLLDLAASLHLTTGARVFGLPRAEMPDSAQLAAILRYAL